MALYGKVPPYQDTEITIVLTAYSQKQHVEIASRAEFKEAPTAPGTVYCMVRIYTFDPLPDPRLSGVIKV